MKDSKLKSELKNIFERIENLEEMVRQIIKELYDVWEISMGEDI